MEENLGFQLLLLIQMKMRELEFGLLVFCDVQGKTVEVGRAHFSSENKRYTILDAPGHKDYVPNMIVGVSQADVAILIISARSGEFESGFDKSGQTREHTAIGF